MINSINTFLQKLTAFHPMQWLITLESDLGSTDPSNIVFGIDMSIEGLRAQKYSIGIFVFLVLSLILFSYIIYLYLPKGEKKISQLKTGEKIMFGSIILGVILAIIIGWIQLIEGYLI